MAARLQPLALAFVALMGCEPNGTENEPGFPPAVTLKDAIAIAAAEVPRGAVVEGELELATDVSRYEIDVLDGSEVREVRLDPNNGDVLGVVSDTEDVATLMTSAQALAEGRVTLSEAIDAAHSEVGGFAVQAEIENDAIVVLLLDEDATPTFVSVSLQDGTLDVEGED